MQDVDLNWIAILVAAIVPMVLGAALVLANALRGAVDASGRQDEGGATMGAILGALD